MGSESLITSSPNNTDDGAILRGRSNHLARILYIVAFCSSLILLAINVPLEYARLMQVCSGAGCWDPHLTAESLVELTALGLSSQFFATYFILVEGLFSAACLAVSALIFWRKPGDWLALLVSFFLMLFGTGFAFNSMSMVDQWPAMWLPVTLLGYVGESLWILLLFIFPNGRFMPSWTRWLGLGWLLWLIPDNFLELRGRPETAVSWFITVGFILAGLGSQLYRYRKHATAFQRGQIKLVVRANAFVFTSLIILWTVVEVWPGLLPNTLTTMIVGNTFTYTVVLLIPLSLCVAVLRNHLWDADPIVNRVLVYGALTAVVLALYIFLVGYLGYLLSLPNNLIISLIATGIVAVIFQPLRDWLQKRVNRLMYGERDDPYTVISQLGTQLEATLTPDVTLSTILETVRGAFKLPFATITLQDELGQRITSAASGKEPQAPVEFQRRPLQYQGQRLGELTLAPRAGGVPFSTADNRLLDDLLRQAGAALYTVKLTSDLRQSRQRLVLAREEERRRLRDELHDGIGPQLAGLTLKVDTTRNQLAHDPVAAATLAELAARTRDTVKDIRQIVYDLRPVVLDQLGLASALHELAKQTMRSSDSLQIHLNIPPSIPQLPAALEVALFRITQEALTNVVRHAGAQHCTVRLALSPAQLCLQIVDDGVGLPPIIRFGVGLFSMRERAGELGGQCRIAPQTGKGTVVTATFPIH